MRFNKTIKRISALGLGASMVGATIFGAMAADLSSYPNQYIKDGKFTGVLVVGDKAAAEDVIGVSDIAVSLQFAATKPAGAVGSTLSASGEAWKVGTSNKILEISENLDSGTNQEAIANITSSSFIDDNELPNLLASVTVSNSKGSAPYEQRLYFNDTSTGYVLFQEDRDDVTADFLYFQTGKSIARYEMEFTTALESDVDDSAGTATSTGDFLTDLEDTDLTILGNSFTIVQARRNGAKNGQAKFILMGGAVRDTLNEGDTKTYTIDGKDYEVTLSFVDSDSAKFTVNGEGTRDMLDGDTDKLSDGITIGVSEILYQDYAGGVHNTEFFLGAQKIEIKDTNITKTTNDQEIKVDDETIDGLNVDVEGSDDDSTYKMDKLVVYMVADDDYYVPAGGKLSENPELDEPELLFTKGWDIEYSGLTDVETSTIEIKSVGSDDYELVFSDGKGNLVRGLPLANTPSGSNLRTGDNDDDLVFTENTTIKKDDYFIITDESDNDGERQSFALRYRGADKSNSDDAIIKFDDLGSNERVERTLSVQTQSGSNGPGGVLLSEVAEIKLGGGVFKIFNVTASSANDFDIVVDLDADKTITSERVSINTKEGARIDVDNSTVGGVKVNITTPNSDDFDDLTPSVIEYNVTATTGEVRLAATGADNHNLKTPDDDDDNSFGYTSMGAYIKFNAPTSDPQTLTVEYPVTQKVPEVWITGKGASFTSTATSSGGAVTVQRIDVGATKLASEVSNINSVNSILVGGPCANAAAATVMNTGADCTEGFEPGVGLLQVWDVGTGNVAMLVAGYSAADTRNAAAVVSNYQDYKSQLTGSKVEVRKVGSTLTVAQPSAAEEEAVEETATE